MRVIVDQVGKWSYEEQQRCPGGARWSLTSQVGPGGPWSTWASPVLLLCNGDTHGSLTSGWSSRANPILWPAVANKKLASGRQVHILFWASPALHQLRACLAQESGLSLLQGLDFLTNNQPTYEFYLLLPKKISPVFARLSTSSTMYLQLYCQFYLLLSKEISPVFARLCFSQLLNHDAESVPARLEVLRIIS